MKLVTKQKGVNEMADDDRRYTFDEYLEEFDTDYRERHPPEKENDWFFGVPNPYEGGDAD